MFNNVTFSEKKARGQSLNIQDVEFYKVSLEVDEWPKVWRRDEDAATDTIYLAQVRRQPQDPALRLVDAGSAWCHSYRLT